jgi:hypothetical protein
MKKNIIYLLGLSVVVTSLMACTKNDGTPTSTTVATFSVRNNTYNEPVGSGYGTYSVSNGLSVVAVGGLTTDNKKALVYAGFYGTTRPVAGTYHVIATTPTTANQVTLSVIDSASVAQQGFFNSIGTDNVNATVTIDGNGKISVTFPVTQVSGTNIDNTNPNNTASTTVATTFSGTIKEQ